MKYLISLLLLIVTSYSFGQRKIKVDEKNDSGHKALVVNIYDASTSQVEKEFKSAMKKLGAKVSGDMADDAKMKTMGDNTFDVYFKARKAGDDMVELVVSVDLGGAYLSSNDHGSQYKAMRDFIYEFAVEITKDAIAGQLKEAEKLLGDMEKDQKKLEKEKEKLNGTIEDCKETIKKSEEGLKTNATAQADQKTKIEGQTKVVQGIAAKQKATN